MVEGASTLRKMTILSGLRRRIRKYIHFTMVEDAYALCKMKTLSGLRCREKKLMSLQMVEGTYVLCKIKIFQNSGLADENHLIPYRKLFLYSGTTVT